MKSTFDNTVQNNFKSFAKFNRVFAGSLSILPAIAALAVMVGVTSSAHAESPHISFRISIGDVRPAPPVVVHQPVVVRPSIEFDRGARAGEHDGVTEGYRDGLLNRRFCDDVKFDFCRSSREFERGYRVGFASGYRNGYDKGSHERCEREILVVRHGHFDAGHGHDEWHGNGRAIRLSDDKGRAFGRK
jgi:hypothetical protein